VQFFLFFYFFYFLILLCNTKPLERADGKTQPSQVIDFALVTDLFSRFSMTLWAKNFKDFGFKGPKEGEE